MNPQKIAIMTDSCTDVPQELVEQYQMYVVPMRVIYHDREYTDKVDITPQQVYDRLEEEVPHTSLPSIDTVWRCAEPHRAGGLRACDRCVHLGRAVGHGQRHASGGGAVSKP